MGIMKSVLVAGPVGYLVSLILAFLIAVALTCHVPESSVNAVAVFFLKVTFAMSFIIGAWVVPASVVPGVVVWPHPRCGALRGEGGDRHCFSPVILSHRDLFAAKGGRKIPRSVLVNPLCRGHVGEECWRSAQVAQNRAFPSFSRALGLWSTGT